MLCILCFVFYEHKFSHLLSSQMPSWGRLRIVFCTNWWRQTSLAFFVFARFVPFFKQKSTYNCTIAQAMKLKKSRFAKSVQSKTLSARSCSNLFWMMQNPPNFVPMVVFCCCQNSEIFGVFLSSSVKTWRAGQINFKTWHAKT